jgi:hypothetical protein
MDTDWWNAIEVSVPEFDVSHLLNTGTGTNRGGNRRFAGISDTGTPTGRRHSTVSLSPVAAICPLWPWIWAFDALGIDKVDLIGEAESSHQR